VEAFGLARLYRTVRHLRASQIFWRIYYLLLSVLEKSPFMARKYGPLCRMELPSNLTPVLGPPWPTSRAANYLGGGAFIFLNQRFDTAGSWFPAGAPLLWLFNLHYFAYWPQLKEAKLFETLVSDWLQNVRPLHPIAWHPYPTSRRICHWIWAYSHFQVGLSPDFKKRLVSSLYKQGLFLSRRLEYHHLGNHLVANGTALVLAGVFLRHSEFLSKGLAVLERQLKEQVLPDGGHYERSPMYHSLVLGDLLAIWQALRSSGYVVPAWLSGAALSMNRFLEQIIIDGKVPLLNDSTLDGIGSAVEILKQTAALSAEPLALTEKAGDFLLAQSGLYVYRHSELKLVFDFGPLGPDFLLAHAHNDTLSFCLNLQGKEILTDSGVFEYAAGPWRDYFRSARAHNVLYLTGLEPNEVWKSFRVGHRGYPERVNYSPQRREISAFHNSYRHLGVMIGRRIRIIPPAKGVIIEETVESKREFDFESNLHFAPDVRVLSVQSYNAYWEYVMQAEGFSFKVVVAKGDHEVQEQRSWYAPWFGLKEGRLCLRIQGKLSPPLTNFKLAVLNAGVELDDPQVREVWL